MTRFRLNHRRTAVCLVLLGLILTTSGCIRLVGKAGYVKQTDSDRTERVVGFDTAEMVQNKQK